MGSTQAAMPAHAHSAPTFLKSGPTPPYLLTTHTMKNFNLYALLAISCLLGACTTQEKKDLKELENMPGITCVTDAAGQTHCGPDSLSATKEE